MAEEIAFENDQISYFEGLVTLTLDQVILHTVVHHSSTSTYTPNLIEIKETFCGWTDIRTYELLRPALLGRLCRRVDDLIKNINVNVYVCLSSICVSQKPHVQIPPNVLYTLPAAMAQSFSDGGAIRYALPVFWMTSYFYLMQETGQDQRLHVSSSWPGGSTSGEFCHPSPTASCYGSGEK